MTIGKFNLLAFSLLSRSNENAAVIFLLRKRIFLKKGGWLWAHISISSTNAFVQGFGKNALGN